MTQKNKIYIAGPMTGYENYNYPKFFKIENILKEKGWIVVNPARITDDFGGQNVFLSDLNAQKTMSHGAVFISIIKVCSLRNNYD